jgi:hypothetical protein
MPFQPIPLTAQATIHMQSDGQSIQHSMYFQSTDGWSGAEITSLAATFADAWQDFMMPLYPDTVQALFAVAVDLASLTGGRAVFSYPAPVNGGLAVTPTPNNVAFAVQIATGSRGRGQQGRLFIGPLSEGATTGNLITQAAAAAFVAAINGVGNQVESQIDLECTWGIIHRVINGVRPANGTFTATTGAGFSNLYLDSQKLRLPFHKKRRATAAP